MRIAHRWNPDPIIKPFESPYATFGDNPILFNDILGNDIDKNASGYAEAKKAATPEYNKRGKQINEKYEPAFAEIFQKLENNNDIMVSFNLKEGDGSIEFTGINDKGQKELSAHWDPKMTKELGAPGLFEESFHLAEAVEGKEMAFPDRPYSGVIGVDINDEVRAKMWVAKNIDIQTSLPLAKRMCGSFENHTKGCSRKNGFGFIE